MTYLNVKEWLHVKVPCQIRNGFELRRFKHDAFTSPEMRNVQNSTSETKANDSGR